MKGFDLEWRAATPVGKAVQARPARCEAEEKARELPTECLQLEWGNQHI